MSIVPSNAITTFPRVRTVSDTVDLSKYDYRPLFTKVRKTIKLFIRETLPVFRNDRQLCISVMRRLNHSIFGQFMIFVSNKQRNADPIEHAYNVNIHMIGFAMWYGYGCKFPKHLNRNNFDFEICEPFWLICVECCDALIRLTRSNSGRLGRTRSSRCANSVARRFYFILTSDDL